jgi:hypothetical protein
MALDDRATVKEKYQERQGTTTAGAGGVSPSAFVNLCGNVAWDMTRPACQQERTRVAWLHATFLMFRA